MLGRRESTTRTGQHFFVVFRRLLRSLCALIGSCGVARSLPPQRSHGQAGGTSESEHATAAAAAATTHRHARWNLAQ